MSIVRHRQKKTDAHELERKGQKIRKFEIYTFLDDSANIGAHYEEVVITEEDQPYGVIRE